MNNLPLSEQYRVIAKEWCAEDEAAAMLEKSKDIVFSQMVGKVIANNPALSMTRAETMVKGSQEWADYVTNMVKQRSAANLKKVHLEYLRMRHGEQMSSEASARAESRL